MINIYYDNRQPDGLLNISSNAEFLQVTNVPKENIKSFSVPDDFDIYTYKLNKENNTVSLVSVVVKTKQELKADRYAERFIYNDEFTVGRENFREKYLFGLISSVDADVLNPDLTITNGGVNELGDITVLKWMKGNKIAIEETRKYIRTETGQEPFEQQTIVKKTVQKFFRHNGEFETHEFDTDYNNDERKKKESSSRTRLIEKTRTITGHFIAGMVLSQGGNMADVATALTEAKQFFKTLSSELSAYRIDRVNAPLVAALTNYPRTAIINDAVINFITKQVNVNYYTIVS